MNRRRRIAGGLVAVVGVTCLLLGGTASASAPFPTPNNGDTVILDCGGLGIFTVQAVTAGEWFHAAEPRLVTNSQLVLVAYAFHYVWAPEGGTTEIWDGAKPAPRNGRLASCSMEIEGPPSDPGLFTATYLMSYTRA